MLTIILALSLVRQLEIMKDEEVNLQNYQLAVKA